MVDQTTATVQIDCAGRMYLPRYARKVLEIYEAPADLKIDITVLNRTDPNEANGDQ